MLFASAFATCGCSYFSKRASVQATVIPEGSAARAGRVAVPVFIQEKFKVGQPAKRWTDAPLTDRFVTGLIRQGYLVVDRANIRTILTANNLTYEDIHREDNISKIGQLLDCDVIVLGRLTLVEHADGQAESRKVTLRGIRVRDGLVVFSFSAVDRTTYMSLTGEALVDQGIEAMFGILPEKKKKTKGRVESDKERSRSETGVIEKTVQLQPAPQNDPYPPASSEGGGTVSAGSLSANVGIGSSTAASGETAASAETEEGAHVSPSDTSSTPPQGN